MDFVLDIVLLLTELFLLFLALGFLMAIVFYVIDRTQTRHSLRRNFPVLARFRYVFEKLGEFFRQYFFALDRENCLLIALSVLGFIVLRWVHILR